MENKLAACPFCGCDTVYEIDRDDEDYGFYPQIYCQECNMTFEIRKDRFPNTEEVTYFSIQEQLYKTWNTRNGAC